MTYGQLLGQEARQEGIEIGLLKDLNPRNNRPYTRRASNLEIRKRTLLPSYEI
jgi:hypothetical protein